MLTFSLISLGLLAIIFRRRIPWIGVVSRVADGDSVETQRWGKTVRIRLAGIDAPEWHQPYGRDAHRALQKLIEHKVVLFLPTSRDRYGRIVCNLFVGIKPVSWVMAANGHAWGMRALPTLLTFVPRIRRQGLWADRNAVEPRIWRLAQQRTGLAPNRRKFGASGR